MSTETRWIWRVMGCLGVLCCAVLAREGIDGYMRHRSTGDQAGFAMLMAFLNFFVAPATSIALLLSAAPARFPEAVTGPTLVIARLAIAIVLAAGAVFFLWFPAHVRRLEAQDLPPGHVAAPGASLYYGVLEPGIMIAFAVLLAGSAVVVLRPSAVRSPLFSALLLGECVVGAVAIVAQLVESLGSVFLTLPTGVLILVVARMLRAIHRPPAKESSAG